MSITRVDPCQALGSLVLLGRSAANDETTQVSANDAITQNIPFSQMVTTHKFPQMVTTHKYQNCNADVAWRQVVEKKMAWGVVILIGRYHSAIIMIMFMKIFLAVQNSSIGLIVCPLLCLLPLTIREFTTL